LTRPAAVSIHRSPRHARARTPFAVTVL
jgi:hypothetical protein